LNKMKRLMLVTLALLVGCNGTGGAGNRFLPGNPSEGSLQANNLTASGVGRVAAGRHGRTKVKLTLRIPRRHRGDRSAVEHPSTISSLTQSVSIAINGGPALIFNATPQSPNCSIGPGGTSCTFAVDAPVGTDTFKVTTYASTSGTGAILDQGTMAIAIVPGKANAVSIRLGPVVSITADSGPGSLRFAVGSANPGDTVMFVIPATSTITLLSSITISNRVTIAGPGVTASLRRVDKTQGRLRPQLTYSGITISGGGTQQLFVINLGATVGISGLILTQGTTPVAARPGGAIYNAGVLSLTNVALTDNKSTTGAVAGQYQAGALYNSGLLAMTDTAFDSNVAANAAGFIGSGGAIYNDKTGSIASSGNAFTNNAAQEGGAVFNNGTGPISFTNDAFSANLGCTAATGCPSVGCSTPTSPCTSSAVGLGAAIFDDKGPGVTITGSNFTDNVAGGNAPSSVGEGGALALVTGSPSVASSTFTGNIAGGGTTNCSRGIGGAIIWIAAGTLQLNNDTFSGNQASGDALGEAGAVAGAAITGSNDAFGSNSALSPGSACGTTPAATAGGIFVLATLKLTTSTFTSNSAVAGASGEPATAMGGAIYYAGDGLTLSGDRFSTNRASAEGTNGNAADGGAIFSASGATQPFASTSNTFASNSATAAGTTSTAFGGAVYSDFTLSTTSDMFTGNSVSGVAQGYGGAIYSLAPLTMNGDTLNSNAAAGTGVAAGGALLTHNVSTAIYNSTFGSNSSTASTLAGGGAILDLAGLTLSGSTLSKNSTSNLGGGLYVNGPETIANTSFTGNKVTAAAALFGGGAIYDDLTGLTIINSTIANNSVAVTGTNAGGGGIYNNGGMALGGDTISGNAVTGTVAGSGGGGIFNHADATLVNDTITGNSSAIDGGGFETYDPALSFTVELINVTLFQNTAAGSGGNIDNPWQMVMTNSIAAGGTAVTGLDIANAGSLVSGDYNIIQAAVSGNPLVDFITHNKLLTNPMLLALSNNGGPTLTNADQASSPGTGLIPFSSPLCGSFFAVQVDQRGFARGTGGKCDVGAYEYAASPSAIHGQMHLPMVRSSHHPRSHLFDTQRPREPKISLPIPLR
jgi:hypothetical protein